MVVLTYTLTDKGREYLSQLDPKADDPLGDLLWMIDTYGLNFDELEYGAFDDDGRRRTAVNDPSLTEVYDGLARRYSLRFTDLSRCPAYETWITACKGHLTCERQYIGTKGDIIVPGYYDNSRTTIRRLATRGPKVRRSVR